MTQSNADDESDDRASFEPILNLFTLSELQRILLETSAPAMSDTPTARDIVQRVRFHRRYEMMPAPDDVELWRQKLLEIEAAWELLEAFLPEAISDLKRESASGGWAQEISSIYQTKALKLEELQKVLKSASDAIPFPPKKFRGKRGPVAARYPTTAAHIFCALDGAWRESGHAGRVTDNKRYEVVARILGLSSNGVEGIKGALRKAIQKELPQLESFDQTFGAGPLD